MLSCWKSPQSDKDEHDSLRPYCGKSIPTRKMERHYQLPPTVIAFDFFYSLVSSLSTATGSFLSRIILTRQWDEFLAFGGHSSGLSSMLHQFPSLRLTWPLVEAKGKQEKTPQHPCVLVGSLPYDRRLVTNSAWPKVSWLDICPTETDIGNNDNVLLHLLLLSISWHGSFDIFFSISGDPFVKRRWHRMCAASAAWARPVSTLTGIVTHLTNVHDSLSYRLARRWVVRARLFNSTLLFSIYLNNPFFPISSAFRLFLFFLSLFCVWADSTAYTSRPIDRYRERRGLVCQNDPFLQKIHNSAWLAAGRWRDTTLSWMDI